MASSGNFCIWNSLNIGSGGSTSLTVGNTNAVMTGADPRTTGTLGGTISDADGYYFETVATSIGGGALTLGIVNESRHNSCMYEQIHSRSGSFMWRPYSSGQFMVETSTNTGYGTFANGDVIGWFVKNSKLYVKKNNSDVVGDVVNTSAGIDISGNFFFPAVSRTVGGGTQTTAILRPDSDSWSYTPPSGFKGLTSKDKSISENIDPAETSDDYPAKNFNTILYTGNATNPHAISGLGFQPDMVWIHRRSGGTSYGNGIIDSSRGASLGLFPPRTDADTSFTNDFSSFDSDGFTLKAGSSMNINNSGSPFVAHCWKANGGTTSSNSEGDITSTVQANTAAGFSIVTYTGDLTSSGNRTVGHGLSKAPDFIIRKSRNTTERWAVSHVGCTSFNEMLELDTTAAEVDKSSNGSMSAPTTTVFSNNYTDGYAVNGTNYIAYCWHNVDGMQRFGSYKGNGNADGPFIYTGFRPRLFVQKRIDSTGSWRVWDASRHPYNPNDAILRWEDSSGEDAANGVVDFLSNGVKIRMTYAEMNASGGDFVYMCWGDVPFKYGNTFPG